MSVAPLAVEPARAADHGAERRARRGRWLVLACYLLGALAVTARLWSDPASRAQPGDPHDVDLFIWFLRYAATAVAHGRLPGLVTTAMNVPAGISLMWNTSALLPGVLLSPVTLLAGPQVSATIMLTLGFAGSAASLFAVLRRWGASTVAAAIGGAVYGFSPALVNSSAGHYQIQFAVLPPLIIDAALRIVTGRGRPVRAGLWLGALAAAQLFTGEELLLQTAVAALLLVVVLAASRPAAVARVLGSAALGLLTAAGVVLATCGYALWIQFFGPLTEHGSPWNPADFTSHPAGFVTPSDSLLFHTSSSALAAGHYYQPEYLAYLGWPLLILLIAAAIWLWRNLAIRAAAVTVAVLEIFSFGGAQGGSLPHGLLPWYWLEHLPVLGQLLPDRFAVLADAAAAAVLAFSLDHVVMRWAADWRKKGVATAVAVLAVLPLIPLPLRATPVSQLPSGWQASYTRLRLAPGARVLIVPVPSGTHAEALRWQAQTGEPVSLAAGYFIGPNAKGQAHGFARYPVDSPAGYLNALWVGHVPAHGLSLQRVRDAITGYWRVSAVIAVTPRGSPLGRFLIRMLGPPAVGVGQVLAWRLAA